MLLDQTTKSRELFSKKSSIKDVWEGLKVIIPNHPFSANVYEK